MNITCRICRRSGVQELIPLIHLVRTQRKAVVEMFNVIGGSRASKIEESDRLPQQVCNGCLQRLERTYSLRMQCRRSLRKLLLHSLDETSDVKRCLMCCEPYGRKELVTVGDVDERFNTKISYMIEVLINVELIKDRFQKYACSSCMIKLCSAYEFKQKCLKSEADWLESVLYPWETMKVDCNNPKHLVVDLYAEIVQADEGTAHCSICLLSMDTDKLGRICQGCKLKFGNDDDMEVDLSAEEECSVRLETVADEIEIEHQELDVFAEEENDDEQSETDFLKESTPKPIDLICRYVKKPEKVFDIIEQYPNDPFPAVLRKGPVCSTCFRFFATNSDMADHQTKTHPTSTCSGTLPCDLCENYGDSFALEQHRRSMDMFVYDFCRSCKLVFKAPKFLRRHKSSQHMDFEVEEAEANYDTELVYYYCCCVSNCAHRYSTEELLRKHCEVAHRLKDKPLQENKCPYCNLQTDNLTEHWKTQKALYKCRVDGCDFIRLCHDAIRRHCSQRPHSKYVHKKEMETKILVPDLKHFTVIGQLDSNMEILQRQGELCCRCYLIFETKEELTAHCALHWIGDDQLFQCDTCSRGFKSKALVSTHSKVQTELTHYYCRVCKMVLWRKIDLASHRVSYHLYDYDLSDYIETVEDHSFTCCGCWISFETEEELVEHRRTLHPPSNLKSKKFKPKCDYCHKVQESPEVLEDHIKFCESSLSYRCKMPECDFQTKSTKRIRKHILLGHRNGTWDVIVKDQAAECVSETKTNHTRRHIMPGHRKDKAGGRVVVAKKKKKIPTDYHCCFSNCTFRSSDYDAVIEHAKELHADRRYQFSIKSSGRHLTCLVCCKGFTQRNHLNAHKFGTKPRYCPGCRKNIPRSIINIHMEECIKILKCTHCGEVMSSQQMLNKHLHHIHGEPNRARSEDPKSVCSICGKLRRNMHTHMQTHDKKRIYKCSTCEAAFHTFNLLTLHQRTHGNERNFQCRHGCGKRYKAPGDRDRHEKLVHLGITPFACNFCEKSFVRERDLRIHFRVHTGLKLYPCSYCLVGFDKLSDFEDHRANCGNPTEF